MWWDEQGEILTAGQQHFEGDGNVPDDPTRSSFEYRGTNGDLKLDLGVGLNTKNTNKDSERGVGDTSTGATVTKTSECSTGSTGTKVSEASTGATVTKVSEASTSSLDGEDITRDKSNQDQSDRRTRSESLDLSGQQSQQCCNSMMLNPGQCYNGEDSEHNCKYLMSINKNNTTKIVTILLYFY